MLKDLVTQNTLGSNCKNDTGNTGVDFSPLLFLGAYLMCLSVTDILFDAVSCYISQPFRGVYYYVLHNYHIIISQRHKNAISFKCHQS